MYTEDVCLTLSTLSHLSWALHTSTFLEAMFKHRCEIKAARGFGKDEMKRDATDKLFAVLREEFDDIEYGILNPED